jgi:hypothetical protein
MLFGETVAIALIDNVRTSQETDVSTTSYEDSFTFLYVDDVRTSQEARTVTGTVLYFMCRWYSYLAGNTRHHGLLRMQLYHTNLFAILCDTFVCRF